MNPALERSLAFLREADKLKSVLRQSRLTFDHERRENDAEHSWHLALMAVVLVADAAPSGVNLVRVLKMVLIHDLVEIDAGDVFLYDEEARDAAIVAERLAEDRIFSLLPTEAAVELRAAWEEFEARVTVDAKFARALDRAQPILQNIYTEGIAWRLHGITASKVRERNRALIDEGAPGLWPLIDAKLDEAVRAGFIPA